MLCHHYKTKFFSQSETMEYITENLHQKDKQNHLQPVVVLIKINLKITN